jgi:galactokinase
VKRDRIEAESLTTVPNPAAPAFEDLFGSSPAVRADAPGRVNVIGEHTDYNGGFVLPAAIPQRTHVELLPRAGDTVQVWSRDIGPRGAREQYTIGAEHPQHDWLDYVRGITHALIADGYELSGFQLRIASDVPVGSGLSSSAALQIALLRALREAFALPLDDIELARLGQRVENEFVGAPVGIMDQMACSLADERHVLFLDTRTLEHERLAIPAGAELIVIDSGVAHSHAAGDYRTRRGECDRAAALLGVPQLRDLSIDALDRLAGLPEPLGRRARHVVTENARVLATVSTFRRGDLRGAGALLSASHASMRDDFEISVPDVDLLVGIADAQPGVYGARLTGGGFGGAIVALASADAVHEAAGRIAAEYRRCSGRRGRVLVPSMGSEPGPTSV